jgi:RecB family exonuclease
MAPPLFSSGAQLQDYLLAKAGPNALVVVPHQRLAHQLWQRQRAAALAGGRAAWEPLACLTLQSWMTGLFQSLWPEVALAPNLTRLALWRRALQAAPPLAGVTTDLGWARSLDDAYETLCRHLLSPGGREAGDAPLVAWRRQVNDIYARLLREEGWLTPGELPSYLLGGLEAGKLTLPGPILVGCLETPATAEEAFLTAAGLQAQVCRLRVQGHSGNIQAAVALPEAGQEREWAAARMLEWSREGLPLHRLALTAPNLDSYAPGLGRLLSELLGPAQTDAGWAYNFSRGETLAQTPLFQAALLPLRFRHGGELREDLVSLLLSPYYRALAPFRELPRWDRLFRERRVDRGWEALKAVAAREGEGAAAQVLPLLERTWGLLTPKGASGRRWVEALRAAWQTLGFPGELDPAEGGAWQSLGGVLEEVGGALPQDPLTPGEFLEWLEHGASAKVLPGPGVQEAGLQVLGLLEMRGLEFDRVLCLGLNAGVFPQPPRSLPLLNAREKQAVLGGTYESQHRFARELYENLLGTAPALILTRPRLVEGEEQVATPFYLGAWEAQHLGVLSTPEGAWLRSPQVRAALTAPAGAAPAYVQAPVALSLPSELSLTHLGVGLGCACRFLLEVLLGLSELPEVAPGLEPRERGVRLHKTLARFVREFQPVLEQNGRWKHAWARKLLRAAAREVLGDLKDDLHWDAEWERWLGEEQGFLWEWLKKEAERYEEGWRWQGVEMVFDGLRGEGWVFSVKGRIDRIDHHPEESILTVWDYKTGKVASAKEVFEEGEEFQLPGYLLALEQGRVPAPRAASRRAGFIGLKSAKEEHLKYQDFPKHRERWPRVLAVFSERVRQLSRVLAAGDFRPQPASARTCDWCPFHLICGFTPPVSQDGELEEEAL